jgi:hypothetical protein
MLREAAIWCERLLAKQHRVPAATIGLRLPLIVMVLAATAIPIELRWPTYAAPVLTLSAWFASDVLANIAGYVPVGIVLADLGRSRAVAVAAGMAIFAEATQLVMVHRDPSIADVASNVAGAMLGLAMASRWNIALPALAVSRGRSRIAALLAASAIVAMWITREEPHSERGSTLPGRLEAHWTLDESSGRAAKDSSGHGLDGRFSREPARVDTGMGRAPLFDGAEDHVALGRPAPLRLVGSMTVSAWIKATSHPAEDAAIVSSHSDEFAGYELDTSDDEGPRTIGFRLGNECGRLAARYGATPLGTGTWYHAAGVYDAEARTLNVYLDGRLDNGALVGSVTGAQHSSRSPVYIGRRSDERGFEFAGHIREVRIYSRALTPAEIIADMKGHVGNGAAPGPARGAPDTRPADPPLGPARSSCAISSDHDDKHLPIAAAGVGLLSAIAAVGLLPKGGVLLWLGVSLAAGVLLPSATLPAINLLLIPLASLVGGASVALSLRRAR